MTNKSIISLSLSILMATWMVACGSGKSTPDTVTDTIGELDTPADDLDTSVDGNDDFDTPADDVDDLDVSTDDSDDAETPEQDISEVDTPDEPEEFQWVGGCEERTTGVAWTVPESAELEEDGGPFLRKPFVQSNYLDTATIVWKMAEDTEQEACVDFSWDGGSQTVCDTTAKKNQYEIRVDGLPANAEITYQVTVGEVKTDESMFRTMPNRPVPMKFAVIADAHNNADALRRFSIQALEEGVDFVISNGDLANHGLPEEYDLYLKGLAPLGAQMNVWSILGNHDDKNHKGYFDAFVLPQDEQDDFDRGEFWWDARFGNVWIGGGWIGGFYISFPDSEFGQVGWYRQQFAKNHFQTAKWRLFFIHQPPYTLEWNEECDYHGEACLQATMIPLLKEFGIQASFHGHMHGIEYGQADGLWTFIAGGLGGGLDGMREEVCQPYEGFPDPWYRRYGFHNYLIIETGCDVMTIRYMDLDGGELSRIVLDDKAELIEHTIHDVPEPQ